MGKRSNFDRIPRDFYPTPLKAVLPLIPHLTGVRTFAEPCCGDGALVRHLESFGLRCVYAGDIATGQDALQLTAANYNDADTGITNPPFRYPQDPERTTRLLRDLIRHFLDIGIPHWLLLPHDWSANKSSASSLRFCSDIAPVGRVKWIPNSEHSGGMDNSAWFRFDINHTADRPTFHPRGLAPVSSRVSMAVTYSSKRYVSVCVGCKLLFDTVRRDQLTCSGACRVRAHRSGELAGLKAHALQFDGKLATIMQARAITMLCPELGPRIQAGELTIEEAQPDVGRAFDMMVMREVVAADQH